MFSVLKTRSPIFEEKKLHCLQLAKKKNGMIRVYNLAYSHGLLKRENFIWSEHERKGVNIYAFVRVTEKCEILV